MPKKEKFGRVVSNKMDKTVVVEVQEFRPHPIYKKIIAQTKNYMASDAGIACNEGDEVRIVETKPVSKTKRWAVAEVVKKSAQV
ncbi:MAG: 30S ribosomal protein S17 [uncultured bacterium]|nr:MAG: 30S ribosomal protein S17 [uncultured bacterium]HBH18058.1 30S ribosomal protein S17 [Cyanobacteria bacterium UBA9579]